MKIAIVYASVTGNTKALAEEIYRIVQEKAVDIDFYKIEEFEEPLHQYQVILIGTYTWGSGEIPREMHKLFHAFESRNCLSITTGIFGTGDSFYPNYCGAVDMFRDMLYVKTNLAATLKVELTPQQHDLLRCRRFVESIMNRLTQYV